MVDLDFRFGGEMRSHRLPITLRPIGQNVCLFPGVS